MVRRVVGTLVKVGAGELDVAGFESLLAGNPPRSGQGLPAEWTAPPSGLFLEHVLYPGDPPLPALVPAVPVPAE
jgi:tRNA pseudouridine38-40 synthase